MRAKLLCANIAVMDAPEEPGFFRYSEWYAKKLRETLDPENRASNTQIKVLARRKADALVVQTADDVERQRRRFATMIDRQSEETIKSYLSSCRHFGRYLGMTKATPIQIIGRLIWLNRIEAETLIEEYIEWMREEEEAAPNSINARLAAIKFFVRCARKVGWCDWELDVDGVKAEKVKETKGPSREEFARIIKYVNELHGPTAARNRLIVYMLSFMGLRISSVLSIDYEDIDIDGQRVKVKWKGKSAKIWRPIPDKTFEMLREWMREHGASSGPLITNFARGKAAGRRLSRRSVDKILTEIGAECETRLKLHAHAFRHFSATEALEVTEDNQYQAAEHTGHADPKMLKTYDDRTEEGRKVANAIEEVWLSDEGDIREDDDFEDFVEEEELEESLEEFGLVSAASASEESEELERMTTGLTSLDKLLGGGLVPGELALMGGAPGIGKSTLLRQVANCICKEGHGSVLYASGEETVDQIGQALSRLELNHKKFLLLSEREITQIADIAERVGVCALIVDSVNTVKHEECDKQIGGTTQIKAVTDHLMEWCNRTSIPCIIVGHIDKKGGIAGPKTLEHMVDAVFLFEGEKKKSSRELSSSKNRFGGTNVVAKLKMTNKGLVDLGVEGDYEQDEIDFDLQDEPPRAPKKRKTKRNKKKGGKGHLRVVEEGDYLAEYDAAFEEHYGEDV